MPDSQLESYISAAREKNIPERQIRDNLANNGWRAEEIDAVLGNRDEEIPIPVPRQKAATGSVSMWDSFQHILMFISLYVLAVGIGLMIHNYIDRFVPGVNLNESYSVFSYSDYQYSILKGETATVIVAFPVYAFLFLAITKRTLQQPQIHNLKSRKILIYLTLIITFIIVLGNIISLVYNFLSGNVTVNFFLHFLDTAGISGIIFGYYLHQVKEDRRANA